MHTRTTRSYSLCSERRLVFRQLASSGPDSASASTPSQETSEEDLLQIQFDVVSDASDRRQKAIDALHTLVQRQLGTQREDISREQKERVRQAIAFARKELELYGEPGEKERIAEIEREFEHDDNPEQRSLSSSAEQEEVEFFKDPAKWFREKSAEVMRMFKENVSLAGALKAVAAVAAMIGAGWEKLKDYVGSAIGPTIASLREVPLVGGIFTSIEKFIGERRKALFAELSHAGIELPLSVASHARRGLDRIEKELSAASKGWGAKRLAGKFAALLREAGIVGERAKDATTAQIDEWIQKLRGEVDSTQKPEVAKAVLDDFGLVGWKEGEAREIDGKIGFSDRGKSDRPYVIEKEKITIGPNVYEVAIRNRNTDESVSNDVHVLFEPHADKDTLVNKSKVVYKNGEGDNAATVAVSLGELDDLVKDNARETADGSLEVKFTKKA